MHPLTIIFSFIVISLIVIMIGANAIHRRKVQSQEREAERNRQASGSSTLVKELEERVRVLERIATDRGHDLAFQIEELRGESPALMNNRNKTTTETERA